MEFTTLGLGDWPCCNQDSKGEVNVACTGGLPHANRHTSEQCARAQRDKEGDICSEIERRSQQSAPPDDGLPGRWLGSWNRTWKTTIPQPDAPIYPAYAFQDSVFPLSSAGKWFLVVTQ